MPLFETDAFVLRTYTLRETDKICLFFAREVGKLRGLARGARRLRSRYGASLEAFTEVSLVYYAQENRELVSVSSCEILRSPLRSGMSSERLAVYHYLSELVAEFLPDQEPNERLYRLIAASLQAIEGAPPERLLAIVRYFEIWLLKLSGFCPDWRTCADCETNLLARSGIWLSNEGVPQCADCSGRGGDPLTGAAWMMVRQALTLPPQSFLTLSGDPRALQQIGSLVVRLIQRILERELRSYEFLDRLRPVESTIIGALSPLPKIG
jgi:DNA repair protein RecO (recombination protein O)